MPVPEGKEIHSPSPVNLDPGVNSDEEEDIDNIFQVSIYITFEMIVIIKAHFRRLKTVGVA